MRHAEIQRLNIPQCKHFSLIDLYVQTIQVHKHTISIRIIKFEVWAGNAGNQRPWFSHPLTSIEGKTNPSAYVQNRTIGAHAQSLAAEESERFSCWDSFCSRLFKTAIKSSSQNSAATQTAQDKDTIHGKQEYTLDPNLNGIGCEPLPT